MDPHSLSTAFAVWAAVVGLVGASIVWQLASLRTEMRRMAEMLATHQLETQRRLTALETARALEHEGPCR